jgi:hypothetical protein
MSRRCFVISPIGEPGSAVREHSDDIFRFIIKPAMEECGIEAVRSDHLTEPGKISEQMFREILGDDLCIAVLTGRNPNVYYELAVAQSAGRPVIILLEQGEVLPFDVQDLRCVYYAMKPSPLIDGVFANEVVRHVRALEAAGWVGPPPIALRPESDGSTVSFLPKSIEYGGEAWPRLLEDTSEAFELMGLSLRGWRSNTQDLGGRLLDKAEAGCRIRILLMHPDSAALREAINDALSDESFDDVRDETARMYRFFAKVADAHERIEVRRIARGCPHVQLVRTDTRAVCIPYLYSDRVMFSPLLECDEGHPLYATLAREFESLWAANAPAASEAAEAVASR